MNDTTQDRSALGVLFREAKYLLQLGFIDQKVLFCPRACNLPAHLLAAVGSNAEPRSQLVWHSNPPFNVTRAMAADLVGPV